MIERIDATAFDGTRLKRPGDWGICFLADWCPFCRAFRPSFEGLDGTVPYRLAIADVTDLDSPLWETFAIEVVPTVAAFRDGRLLGRRDGVLGAGLEPAELTRLGAFFRR